MNPNQFVEEVLRTESKPDNVEVNMRALHAVMGIQTESGELTDAYKRNIFYGVPLDPINLKEEVGDILWYIAVLLDELGSSFEESMSMVIAKLRKRYPKKFTADRASERDLSQEREAMEGEAQP